MNRVFKRGIAMALNPPKDPLVAIVGATGTGKSKVLRSLFCKAHELTAADS
jgi:ABC-type phosphate/phosphonate transport system ATPase subunit